MTLEEALEKENEILTGPFANLAPAWGMRFDDDLYLQVIDQAERDGKTRDLPAEVAARLEEWRREKAVEEAFRNAPWKRGQDEIVVEGPIRLRLPRGWQFLAAADVETLGKVLGEKVPVGPILASEEDHWIVALQVTETGHYDSDALKVEPASALAAITEHYRNPFDIHTLQGQGTGFVARWLAEPRYDAGRHLLSWASTVPHPPYEIHKVVRFGRTWALTLIPITSSFEQDAETILETGRTLADSFSFVPGEDYADAGLGVQAAQTSVIDLISGGPSPAMQQAAYAMNTVHASSSGFPWGKFLLRVGPILLLVVTVLLAKRQTPAASSGPATDGIPEETSNDASAIDAASSGTPASERERGN